MSERYFYPLCLRHSTEDNSYIGRFPDLPDAHQVRGTTIESLMDDAKRALCDALDKIAKKKEPMPKASLPDKVVTEPGEMVMLVEFDRVAYKQKKDTRVINKSVTMPAWMAEMAKEKHINCSQLLQKALQKEFDRD